MRFLRVLLIVIAVVCFGVALSYPIRYRMAQESNNSDMDALSAMRERAQREEGIIPETGEDATAAITTDDENERSDGENAAERSGVQAEADALSDGSAAVEPTEAGGEAPSAADSAQTVIQMPPAPDKNEGSEPPKNDSDASNPQA